IHIHADELVRGAAVEIARELHGVFQSFVAMRESVLNALLERTGDGAHQFGTKIAANGVAAQRQGKARHVAPPLATVEDLLQASPAVRKLPFVDDQSRL